MHGSVAAAGPPPRGRVPVPLPHVLEAACASYTAALDRAPLSAESRRTYASKVRQYLAWLGAAAVDGDPLTDPAARDWAVRDYAPLLAASRTVARPRRATGYLRSGDTFPYLVWGC